MLVDKSCCDDDVECPSATKADREIEDIDSVDDHLAVPEYAADIFKYLKACEVRSAFDSRRIFENTMAGITFGVVHLAMPEFVQPFQLHVRTHIIQVLCFVLCVRLGVGSNYQLKCSNLQSLICIKLKFCRSDVNFLVLVIIVQLLIIRDVRIGRLIFSRSTVEQ